MKKLLSLTLALIMAMSCFAAAIPAQAQNDAECVNVTVHGYWYNALVQSAAVKINSDRSSAGYSSVTLDKNLTEIAQKRAAECAVYVDSNKSDDYRPNGEQVTQMLSGYSNTLHDWYTVKSADLDALNYLGLFSTFSSSSFSKYKSMGLAILKYNDVYIFYYIVSTTSSSSKYTRTTDITGKYTFALNLKYVTKNKMDNEVDSARVRLSLTSMVYAGGLAGDYIEVSNDQLRYSSTNASVMKVKGALAFPKKNGSYTLNSYNSAGKLVATYSNSVSGLKTYLKIGWRSVKSKKKKAVSLSWQKNITDATGYQIQYSTNKKFKKGVKTVNVNGKNSTSKTIKKLKRKKVYYVRIRAYIDQGEGEKLYSSWSTVKKVKIK